MSSFLPGMLDLLLIPLFSFSFCFLPCCEGIFLALSGVWSLLLMYSSVSLRIVPFVDVFLMYSGGEKNSSSYISTILTPRPPPPDKVCCLLLSWALRKPNFLNFFNNFFSILLCSLFLKFFVCLTWWLDGSLFLYFCFVRLFFIEGQRNRGSPLSNHDFLDWFSYLLFAIICICLSCSPFLMTSPSLSLTTLSHGISIFAVMFLIWKNFCANVLRVFLFNSILILFHVYYIHYYLWAYYLWIF